jgi:hypothetical protein
MDRDQVEHLLSLAIALVLALLGGWYLLHERSLWLKRRGQSGLSEADRGYFQSRYRRRVRGAVLLVACGLAVVIGSHFLDPRRFPRSAALLWLLVLAALFYLVVSAVADLRATVKYAQRQRYELSQKFIRSLGGRPPLETEEEAEENGNGRPKKRTT